MMIPAALRRPFSVLATLLLLAGCGGGTTPVEPPEPPVISVTGVADGAAYPGPVTIQVAVDRGSYEATLNGRPFSTGQTVSDPGVYTLVVTARASGLTSTTTVAFTIAAPAGGVVIIRMFNLGAPGSGAPGDAILVTDSSSLGLRHALIDAGPGQSGENFVAQRLAQLGVDSLSFMLLTHAHADHFQGMTAVLNGVDVGRFFYNGSRRSLGFYQAVLTLARQRADTVIIPADTLPVLLGGARFTLVPPLPNYINETNADSDEENEGSLGALLRRGSFEMFFTGDGEYEANARWRTQFGSLTRDVDALKVGHHGANNAIFDSGTTGPSGWLDHTSPDIAIISANGTSHPRLRALNRLLTQSNLVTYCTNVHGDITIRVFSTGSYDVTVQRNAGSVCVPGRDADT